MLISWWVDPEVNTVVTLYTTDRSFACVASVWIFVSLPDHSSE